MAWDVVYFQQSKSCGHALAGGSLVASPEGLLLMVEAGDHKEMWTDE